MILYLNGLVSCASYNTPWIDDRGLVGCVSLYTHRMYKLAILCEVWWFYSTKLGREVSWFRMNETIENIVRKNATAVDLAWPRCAQLFLLFLCRGQK